jgi:transcriptional regulator with XRE-family HTH domain
MPDDRVRAGRRAVADRIRAARLHANLSQEQVTLGAGIRIATYSTIEQGHSSPLLDTLIRIADALDVDLADLVRA